MWPGLEPFAIEDLVAVSKAKFEHQQREYILTLIGHTPKLQAQPRHTCSSGTTTAGRPSESLSGICSFRSVQREKGFQTPGDIQALGMHFLWFSSEFEASRESIAVVPFHARKRTQVDPWVGSCGSSKYSEISQGHSLLVLIGAGGHSPSYHSATEVGKQPPYHGNGKLLLKMDQSGQLRHFRPPCTYSSGKSRVKLISILPGPVCGLGGTGR
ncbi:hypothetical protein PG997_015242 [Apiospora hydei]|uniref:Uncharacterized protein n=1 Tax=Apiospora hydei TaxID=1337664 RepID=A0ABR1UQ15_9PEZI